MTWRQPTWPTWCREPSNRYAVLPFDNDVQVGASDGTVTLTGHIESWAEHDAVIDAAWRGIGVKNVRDDLVITG